MMDEATVIIKSINPTLAATNVIHLIEKLDTAQSIGIKHIFAGECCEKLIPI